MFAGGKTTGLVQLYQYDGNQYEEVQDFSVGFIINGLVLNSDRLFASGFSSDIRIYGSNGAGYWPEQIVSTRETRIFDVTLLSDSSQLLFGGESGYFSIYEHLNGSYSL